MSPFCHQFRDARLPAPKQEPGVRVNNKRLWMPSWMLLTSTVPFFTVVCPNISWGELGGRPCATTRKQETQTTVSLSLSRPMLLVNEFTVGKLWIVATEMERSRPVQELTPCPLFSHSLYSIYFAGKIEEFIVEKSSFLDNSSLSFSAEV